MKNNVVITGMGIISSIGETISDFSEALKDGLSGIILKELEDGSSPNDLIIGAFLKDFNFKEQIGNLKVSESLKTKMKRFLRSSFIVHTSIMSAVKAWINAGLEDGYKPAEKIGIIVAGQNISSKYLSRLYTNKERVKVSSALRILDTDLVGTLSEIFTINGEGCLIGGASATGNVGIIKAYQMVQTGIVDACMVVGTLADLSSIEIEAYKKIGAMGGKKYKDDPNLACRPFDQEHEGFIYGQASGCLILESLESAKKRNAKVWAEILGTSIILDGNSSSNPGLNGEAGAMMNALKQAGLKTTDISYINSHGSSSALGDDTEIMAIKKVFGEQVRDIWINATKGLTGHCLYSAGMVEVIASTIQMNENFVHPNKNLINPINPTELKDGETGEVIESFVSDRCKYVGDTKQDTNIEYCLSNSFGFGGINTSIILKRGGDNYGSRN